MKMETKLLQDKGFCPGDIVKFEVENQVSGGWQFPLHGILRFNREFGEFYIEIVYKNKRHKVGINHGYDAYVDTIELIEEYDPLKELVERKQYELRR